VNDILEPQALTAGDRARYARAIAFAEAAHDGQLRKGTDQPYAVHPLEVGALLAYHYPQRPALIVAGFLHDTIEDTHVRSGDLTQRFGPETARLVVAVTKRWYRAPWSLDVGDLDVVRLKAADGVSNIRATVVDLRVHGPQVWRRFRGGERAKRDYYRRLTHSIGEAIPAEPLALRLIELQRLLEAERPAARR
jgi:(p)ppGpp synthase/HD superfamily hydrolase